mgnify:FL=1
MQVIIDTYEPKYFQENLEDAVVEPLKVGDFHLVFEDGRRIVIERKTWDDAYNSWLSKRLELQISNMIEEYDEYILLIEGNKSGSRLFRSRKYNQLEGLQTFLNRMSLEVIPVVYTSSKKKTVDYFHYLNKRIESGDYKTLVRKTKIVKSSRNVYHNILSLIPGITIDRSKSLYNHFNSFDDFVKNVQKAKEVDDKKRWHNQVDKIEAFMGEEWEDNTEREIIFDNTS